MSCINSYIITYEFFYFKYFTSILHNVGNPKHNSMISNIVENYSSCSTWIENFLSPNLSQFFILPF